MKGRNQPCSCGSGKKFKRCCGNEVVRIDDARRARVAQTEIDRSGRTKGHFPNSTLMSVMALTEIMGGIRGIGRR